MTAKRFLPWVLFFMVLLISIPVMANSGYATMAKFLGFLTVLAITGALSIWRNQTRKIAEKKPRVKLNLNDRFWLKEHIPFYAKLGKKDKIVFEDRIGIFLSEIQISEIGSEVPEKETCFYVAASAIIAYWGLPYWNYGDLAEVLVYPQNYSEEMEFAKSGQFQGQIFHGGLMNNTMILSMRALVHGFSNSTDKKNVGVHEFAHLLDKSDGEMDGIPVDMHEDTQRIWAKVMQREIAKIRNGKSDLNPYGGTSNIEFFAVATEYYKERPELLKKKNPEIYHVLNDYFQVKQV